eukprot:5496126-Prymnesium_polylepis.2
MQEVALLQIETHKGLSCGGADREETVHPARVEDEHLLQRIAVEAADVALQQATRLETQRSLEIDNAAEAAAQCEAIVRAEHGKQEEELHTAVDEEPRTAAEAQAEMKTPVAADANDSAGSALPAAPTGAFLPSCKATTASTPPSATLVTTCTPVQPQMGSAEVVAQEAHADMHT